ncbi:MAG: hypothetical protein ACYDH5_14550 [Acidimicrobiales bacterium]
MRTRAGMSRSDVVIGAQVTVLRTGTISVAVTTRTGRRPNRPPSSA